MSKSLVAILISSLGSVMMWLLLVPYFTSIAASSSLVGLLGMERQIMSVVGAVLVAVWVDQGRTAAKFAILQGAQTVLAAILLATILMGGDPSPVVLLVWTALRFGVVGACSVLAFRLIADETESNARGAIYHMITSPQGAMVFASVICAVLPVWFGTPFLVALTLDFLASAALTGYLVIRAMSEPRTATDTLSFDVRDIGAPVIGAVKSYWAPSIRRWSTLQIIFLISLSGMMMYAYAIAEQQTLVDPAIAFSAAWFFYGLAFWVTAPLLRTHRSSNIWALAFGVVLIACAVAIIVLDDSRMGIHCVIYVILTFVNAYWIHFTNVRIIENTPAKIIGLVRSSMTLYLGLVFGVGEQVFGVILEGADGLRWSGILRLVAALALVTMLIVLLRRDSRAASRPVKAEDPAEVAV